MAYKVNPFTGKLDYYESTSSQTIVHTLTANLVAGQNDFAGSLFNPVMAAVDDGSTITGIPRIIEVLNSDFDIITEGLSITYQTSGENITISIFSNEAINGIIINVLT